jgi:hypothetical protein
MVSGLLVIAEQLLVEHHLDDEYELRIEAAGKASCDLPTSLEDSPIVDGLDVVPEDVGSSGPP